MKKLILIVTLILTISYLYLIYKTWVVFGFWTILWTSVLTILSGILLNRVSSRTEADGKITYNPKEWPKFIQILLNGLVGYYLFIIISSPEVSKSDFIFGLCYLVLLTALPIALALFKLIRDRNDYVQMEGDILMYRDNSKNVSFNISTIESVEGLKDLKLNFIDGTNHLITLSQMNFKISDVISLTKDINARLPQTIKSE